MKTNNTYLNLNKSIQMMNKNNYQITNWMKRIVCLSMMAMSIMFSQSAKASHLAGMEITYQHLTGNTYRIIVNYYRDCAGIAPRNSLIIQYSSALCQQSDTIIAFKNNVVTEISDVCSNTATTCSGGTAPGIQRHTYTVDLTLPAQCSDWKIGIADVARNAAITTLNNPGNTPLYVEARINNTGSINNTSPTFTNDPVGFACINQVFNYNHGAIDVDGDSLVYELITPQGCATDGQGQVSIPYVPSNVSFIAPFSTTNPLPSSTPFVVNPLTGAISFKPNASAVGVLAIRVKEFRNGVLIGTIIRDLQFQTVNCGTNNLPVASGLNGGSSYSATVCAGDSVCYTINSTDAEQQQIVTMTTNIAQSIPGATFTISTGSRPTGTVCWKPSAAFAGPNTFTVIVQDDACPTNGQQVFSYTINVTSLIVTATANTNDVTTTVSGGTLPYTYVWSSGETTDGLIDTENGTYTVTVTDANGCTGTASVVVNYQTGPCEIKFDSTVTNVTCFGKCNGAISFAIFGGTAPFQYIWSNGKTTKNVGSLCVGTYTMTVTDATGCSKTYTNKVKGPKQILPNFVVTPCTTPNCTGGLKTVPTLGVAPYKYKWSNSKTTALISNLCNGTYTVTITDKNGCTRKASKKISGCGSGPADNFSDTDDEETLRVEQEGLISIFPNPSNSTFFIQNFSGSSQAMSIFDITGKVVSSIQLNDELTIGSDLEPGIYFIKIQSNTGVQTYKISKVR